MNHTYAFSRQSSIDSYSITATQVLAPLLQEACGGDDSLPDEKAAVACSQIYSFMTGGGVPVQEEEFKKLETPGPCHFSAALNPNHYY